MLNHQAYLRFMPCSHGRLLSDWLLA